MTLRLKFRVLLIALHIVAATLGAILLWDEYRPWILLLEALVAGSLLVSWRLLRSLTAPMEILTASAQFLREGDLTHTFTQTSSKELNKLVDLFNGMIGELRMERIRSEERQYFLEKVIAASPIGIITFNLNGAVERLNSTAATLLGCSTKDLIGTRLEDHHHALAAALAQLESGQSVILALQSRQRLKCSRSHFMDRGFPRTFLLIEELTEELWKTEREAYTKLIRTISHELNNSLGATHSLLRSCLYYADQLQSSDREDFEQAMRVAMGRTESLNDFMKSYADVVRLPSPTLRSTDVSSLLDRIADWARPACNQRAIELSTRIDRSAPHILLDAVQMEQALVNILTNALEAIDHDGKIILGLIQSSERWHVTVEDSGPGLSAEAASNLFVPFFSTKPHGQGIGLTLVYEILSANGCTFSLDSNPTIFRIVLPKS